MPEGTGYTLTRHDGKDTMAMLEEVTAIYLPAYAEPPYNGQPLYSREKFTERTTAQAQDPQFRLIAARTREGELAGFSFGLPFGVGRWWHDVSGSKPDPGIVEAPKFSVIELVVAAAHRGQGLARRLMDALLDGRPEAYAMLLAHPEARARAIYDRWGWTEVAKVQTGPTQTLLTHSS
ncbi:N-acetyltransferase family protein [Spirillospora sp. CA-255316]